MYKVGWYKTKMFKDSDGDPYNGVFSTKAEEQLEDFLNELNDYNRNDYQDFHIKNISMSVDNGKTSILLVWKYV